MGNRTFFRLLWPIIIFALGLGALYYLSSPGGRGHLPKQQHYFAFLGAFAVYIVAFDIIVTRVLAKLRWPQMLAWIITGLLAVGTLKVLRPDPNAVWFWERVTLEQKK